MSAIIALIGRPNVGKSSVFNLLTNTNASIVADYPGLTRDRKYGAELNSFAFYECAEVNAVVKGGKIISIIEEIRILE